MSTQQNTSSAGFGLRAVQFSRLTRRGILLGLSLPQLIALATGVLSIVGALYAGGGILLAWTAPIWLLSAVLAWTPVGGRKLIEWVPVTFRWVARTQARQTKVDPYRIVGIATRTDVTTAASEKALLRRAGQLRPSIQQPAVTDVGYLLGASRNVNVWASVEDSILLIGPRPPPAPTTSLPLSQHAVRRGGQWRCSIRSTSPKASPQACGGHRSGDAKTR